MGLWAVILAGLACASAPNLPAQPANPAQPSNPAAVEVAPVAEAPSNRPVTPPAWGVRPLTDDERAAMQGVVWQPGCPVALEALAVVHVRHHTPAGHEADGLLVAHASVSGDLLAVFRDLYDAGFVLERVAPAQVYGGDDDALMGANVTSAFNCRPVAGTSSWSAHASGLAIDVNPLWNPYVRGERVSPPTGAAWVDRANVRPGMIIADDLVVRAFAARGFKWGGNWSKSKDYQHFSTTGR